MSSKVQQSIASGASPEQHEIGQLSSGAVSVAKVRAGMNTGLTVLLLFAVAACIVAAAALKPALAIMGFFVAFLMMLFIGLPLILASIEDAVDAPSHD